MSTNKTGISNVETKAGPSLGGTLLKIVAVGVAGGAALIGGAMAVGDEIAKKQVRDYEKKEAEREAQKEAVREATANEYDPEDD